MRSRKNLVIVFLSLATVTAAAIAWRQHQEISELRMAMSNLADREPAPSEPAATLMESDFGPQPISAKDSAGPTRLVMTSENPADQTPRNRRNGPGDVRMMDRPEVQQLMAAREKSALDAAYSGLFKKLALTPDQLEQFKDLLVEKRTAMMDVMAAAREEGVNPRRDRELVAKLLANAQAEIDEGIRGTLGESGFAQYESYEKTLPQRSLVGQLEQRLSYSSTPLTPQQSESMVAILAATSTGSARDPVVTGGPRPTMFGTATGAPITDGAINQALGVLAAPQVEALRQLQQEQQAQAAFNAQMRNRSRAGSPATSPQPTTTPTPSPGPRPTPSASGGG